MAKKKSRKINFSGKIIGRGSYQRKLGKIINLDVNGSYNILRKADVQQTERKKQCYICRYFLELFK